MPINEFNSVPNSGSNLPDISPYKASVLSHNALDLPEEADPNQKIDEEIEMRRQIDKGSILEKQSNISTITNTPVKEPVKAAVEIEEETQSVNEQELIDKNGEFIIFSDQIASNGASAIVLPGDKVQQDSTEGELEENFSKLNYVNKINILLKALMIERNKNSEFGIKNSIMKREYINKVKTI